MVSRPAPSPDVHDPALQAAERACTRIAPVWPLDRSIAVNPFWPQVDRPFAQVAAELNALSGSRQLMPRAWYRERVQAGQIRPEHLQAAIDRAGADCSVASLEALLTQAEPDPPVRARMVDVVDATRDPAREAEWRNVVVRSISQLCASVFDQTQAAVRPGGSQGLFARWRQSAAADLEPILLMGLRGYRQAVRELPDTPHELIPQALDALAVRPEQHELYLTTLLLDVNGWASWCAWLRFDAELRGDTDHTLLELLAVRLAWEWILLQTGDARLASRWRHAMAAWPDADAQARAAHERDWLLQDALEIAWQERVFGELPRTFSRTEPQQAPAVQAAFCIDVRSEVFRRALEAQDPSIETIGFAGFFGVPLEYAPVGSEHRRALLPGLLAPSVAVTDTGVPDTLAEQRRRHLDRWSAFKAFKTGSVSSFAFVDAIGPLFAGRLILDSLHRPRAAARPERAGLGADQHAHRKPRLTHTTAGEPLDAKARTDLALGILRGMGLTRRHGRLIALLGHGSQTRNNPHAAGLDCGACCGQAGDVNARAAAALLNRDDVRQGLSERGLPLPDTTWFVAGLHDTTTDQITLFDLDEVPDSHADDLRQLTAWLDAAGAATRRERAPRLGLPGRDDRALHRAVRSRATDWAQVQPEWGLADNCAFIIAPRWRTRDLDLQGRAFLHDYHHRDDPDHAILEGILTAPMIVTHWINLQYYASTVDNARYGSGNKVLHNVVGGHIGVFEGNGGDLRIGLPRQCLHDGERWVHTPQRLSVLVEAPRQAISGIIERHDTVRHLVDNGWVHLFQLDPSQGQVHAWRDGGWTRA